MKYLSFIVYIPLQILAIPLAIVGLLLTAYKQIIVSKRLGVSQTAIEIINGRWTCLLYTSPSPRDKRQSRMPSSA